MAKPVFLRIALHNINGLSLHSEELKSFLVNQNIDIMLISETHFTTKNYLKIPKYNIYNTNHPSGRAHGGTAVIIKTSIKHHELKKYAKEQIQATNISVEELNQHIIFSAVYCPPKHKIKEYEFLDFFRTLGNRFIAGGDYNSKHTHWGSRIINPRGRQLLKATQEQHCQYLSTGQPTYWPTDQNKTPDCIDICVTKGIAGNYLRAESCYDTSSDHSPVIVTYSTQVLPKTKPPSICSNKTNWKVFRELFDTRINFNIPLKSEDNLNEAVEQLNNVIQNAAWDATTDNNQKEFTESCHQFVKQKIEEKRRLRKAWQRNRLPAAKTKLNKASKELKELLTTIKNQSIQDYLANLTASEATGYSLWKATKKIKQPQLSIPPIRSTRGKWARSAEEKATSFAEHLCNVFKPFPSNCSQNEDDRITGFLKPNENLLNEEPIQSIKMTEVKKAIRHSKPKKAPGYDLITGRVLKELSEKGIRMLTIIFNSAVRLQIFPAQWKTAQIIMLPKPGKNPEEMSSYRPISLLPTISKLFEKILLDRIKPHISARNLIPNHQFGFRQQHGTIEQVHRVVQKINQTLQTKRYCSAAFLDISQAFDKVWHTGLLFKLKRDLPHNLFKIMESYLRDRLFQVRFQDQYSPLCSINAGVPQGSVLGPLLYLLYTADLPTMRQTTTSTFADDTAILALHTDPIAASALLQENLNLLQNWLRIWRIKANEVKSTHITYTLRKGTCPPVSLNNQQLPQQECAKYLGMHLDRRLTWKTHIWKKRLQLAEKVRQMYWIIGKKSKLSTSNKILVYKSILKPIWTYGIQLWGSASNSNVEIVERFQNGILRLILNLPRYVPSWLLLREIGICSVKEEIMNSSQKYQTRLKNHPNQLAVQLLNRNTNRLRRTDPLDLTHRFNGIADMG